MHRITKTQNIRDLRQWLCWRIEERGGKPTKIPYSPLTGERASSTDPETWASYSEAVEAYREHGYGGIGLVFSEDDPFCGVDLDGCLNPETGEIEEWAKELIEHLDSYTELSPSGTGFHILVKAELPPGGRRKGKVEVYDSGRFFTVTGKHLPGTPRKIEVRQVEVEVLHRKIFGFTKGDINGHLSHGPGNNISDTEILARAGQAVNGEAFEKLWAGDSSGFASRSEADLALCSRLVFWTGCDPGRVDKLFRQSGLYRPKWDERHYSDGRTYGEATVEKALEDTTEFNAASDDQ